MIENQEENSSQGLIGGLLKNPLIVAGASFSVGIILGWMVLGWLVFPVKWEDASAEFLRKDLQVDYVEMIVDSYNLRADMDLAMRRLQELGEAAPQIMAEVAANPVDELSQLGIQILQQQYGVGGGIILNPTNGDDGAQPEDTGEPSNTPTYLLIACVATFILGGALVLIYFIRMRQKAPKEQTAFMKAQELTRQADKTDYEARGESPPLAQWMTTYLLGDDLFDDSFSIDSAVGEFLGECGVGIADTIGVGDPKRVSAFEIWLFDKNDIQTVTRVLMSNHIYTDEASRDRLAAKGDPILANVGTEIVLETETLQMIVRIIDLGYGEGALPDQSFFDQVTMELAVWAK